MKSLNDLEPFYAGLGRRIEGLRRSRGLTQEQLGQKLSPSLTRASVSNIETGKQRILAHMLFEIAGALDVPITELVPDTQQQPVGDSSDIGAELAAKLQIGPADLKKLTSKLASSGRRGGS